MSDGQAAQTPMIEDGGNTFSVTITIPKSYGISRICFVLFFPQNHQWDNNQNQNYSIPLLSPLLFKDSNKYEKNIWQTLIKIYDRENRHHWEMGMRLEFLQDLVVKYSSDAKVLSLLEIYLQIAAQGHLPWRKNYDRQTYILAPKIQEFSLKISGQILRYPQWYLIWRRMLQNLPSSGRDLRDIGLAIRVKILECKDHQNRLIYDKFMYEFHQKLHNASGPEDVIITCAYLAFLDSKGDLHHFFKILFQAGLAKYEVKNGQKVYSSLLDQFGDNRAILSLPTYKEEKAKNTKTVFKELLELLKKFYGGLELEESIKKILPKVDPNLQKNLQKLLKIKESTEAQRHKGTEVETSYKQNKNSLYTIKIKNSRDLISIKDQLNLIQSILTIREKIYPKIFHGAEEEIRDFLLLDLVLEEYSIATGNSLLNNLSGSQEINDDFLLLIYIFIFHLHYSGFDDPELSGIKKEFIQWKKKAIPLNDWYLKGKAILDHLNRVIQQQVSHWIRQYQPLAEAIGTTLCLEKRIWGNFCEENIRSGILFLLSRLINHAEQSLRKLGKWPAYEILVKGTAKGMVLTQSSLSSDSGNASKPHILLLENLQGDEDIPSNIVGIISKIARDRMSHFGIRAREQGVVWIYLNEELELNKLQSHEKKWIELSAEDGHFRFYPIDEITAIPTEQKRINIKLPEIQPVNTLQVLFPTQYRLSTVGPKAYQLKVLKDSLLQEVKIPDSLCIPFGVFDHILQKNYEEAQYYHNIQQIYQSILENRKQIKTLVENIRFDKKDTEFVKKTVQKHLGNGPFILRSSSNAEDLNGYSGAGLYESYAGVSIEDLTDFIKKVWASKWTKRAVSNRIKAGINHDIVHMSVLIQKLIPADYSFVVHTQHPLHLKKDIIYIELVQGLGEALVSGTEGQGYGYTCDRGLTNIERIGFANKGYRWLLNNNNQVVKELADYTKDFLARQKQEWVFLIKKIAQISLSIESTLGGFPQDIEGVITGNTIYIVQSRPQIIPLIKD